MPMEQSDTQETTTPSLAKTLGGDYDPLTPAERDAALDAVVEQVKEQMGPLGEDCGHPLWTLGCQRCFNEMKRLADDAIIAGEQALAEATFQGATLFGWHIFNMASDMEMQLTSIADRSLDLHQRDNALTAAKNLRNLSTGVVRICNSPTLMQAALESAAHFAARIERELKERGKAKNTVTDPAPTTTATGIVLTDVS